MIALKKYSDVLDTPGLKTFIIVGVAVTLLLIVGLLVFFMIRRSSKMNQPPVNISGRVLEKRPTAMQEEEVVLEHADGTRIHYRMMSGKPVICVGDVGIFEIRGGFITNFFPNRPN